jgi:hypothetical protein
MFYNHEMEYDVNMHWRIYLLNDKNVMEKENVEIT